MGIQLLVDTGPDNSKGDKHGRISDDINENISCIRIIQQVDKGNPVDPEGKYLCGIKNEGLYAAVYRGKGKEGKTGNNNDADIYKQQLPFPFPPELFASDCAYQSGQTPNNAYQYNHCCVGYLNHFLCSPPVKLRMDNLYYTMDPGWEQVGDLYLPHCADLSE